MKLAKDFLARFQRMTPPDDAVRKAVAVAVHDVAGVPIKKEHVKISRGVAFVECSSIAKSAIRAARGEVLETLYRELPKARETVRDIR